MKALIIFLILSINSFVSQADSDGAVAIGDGFIAYTSFAKTSSGQDLNIVALTENGEIKKMASTHLPISWSKISTKENFIYLETHNKLYKYKFSPPNSIELSKLSENKNNTVHTNNTNRKRNKHGDWINKSGDCETVYISGKQYYLCLAYTEYFSKFKFGTLIFHDKHLISRSVEKTISLLQINSKYETIH